MASSDPEPLEAWEREGVELVERIQASRPDLVQLATVISPAVRIEPGLLRYARLYLTEPRVPVAAEADLWFSPLVGSHSSSAFVLDRGAAFALRRRLVEGDPLLLARACDAAILWHRNMPPTIRLEEQIVRAALLGEGEEELNRLLARALVTMREYPDRERGLARWAIGAYPSLPPNVRASEAGGRLIQRARGRVQDPIMVGAELLADGVYFSHPPTVGSRRFPVPPTNPITFTVRSLDPPMEDAVVELERRSRTLHKIPQAAGGAPTVEVETSDGRCSKLHPISAPSTTLDLGDIQGDILRAYGNDFDCTTYAFVAIECPPEQARAWFSGLVKHVTSAEPWTDGEKPRTTLNVAVTAAGLLALGVSRQALSTFSHEFRDGMSSRAALLGDVGPSDPRTWEPGLGSGDAHVLLTINAQRTSDRERALGKMSDAMAAAGGVRIIYQENTELLPAAREHFGFADGFAQPAIEGTSDHLARGGGVPLTNGAWRALATGEFILGYPDEDTRVDPKQRLPTAPAAPLGNSGTYMVWRKLYQDVARWRRVMRDAAKRYAGGDERKLSAKVVGRWDNGAPVVTHPDSAPQEYDPKTPDANDFRYDKDRDGMRCPLGAHVRRSNPRDALGFEGHLSFRHRIIRRGMPYGPPLAEGVYEDDGVDRGLVFVCFQASLSRQFEGVQVQWLNDGNIFGLGHDKDFILGDPHGMGKMTIQGRPPFFLAPQEVFVRTRGGEYLFVPGMTALAALADGTTG